MVEAVPSAPEPPRTCEMNFNLIKEPHVRRRNTKLIMLLYYFPLAKSPINERAVVRRKDMWEVAGEEEVKNPNWIVSDSTSWDPLVNHCFIVQTCLSCELTSIARSRP